MKAFLDIVYVVVGIVLFLGIAYVVWAVAWSRVDRPRKLKRSLRPIARCTLLEAVSLRDLAPGVSEAAKQVDNAIAAGPSTFRQPSCSLILFENDRPRPFLLILERADKRSPKHARREIDFELRSGFSEPPAPRMRPSKRVLDAVDRALRSMSNVEGIRWTRDRDQWFDRPFDS